MLRVLQVVLCGGFVVALAGCGEGAGKLAVNGTVNFEGKPLEKGSILFELDGDKDGFRSGGIIENGKFALLQKHGLKPGTYIVRISSSDGAQVKAEAGEAPPPSKERIPASWNSDSKEKREVKSGATEFTFDIK
jgi:hypothetical protein